MITLTDAERRGSRLLAALLLLGTAHDLWSVHHPRWLPPAEDPPAAVVGVGSALPATRGPDPVATQPPTVDLNTATVAELDALPGIGPVLAARIVEHRRSNGAYRGLDELLSVPGIGPRLLERLRPMLRDPTGTAP